MYGVLIYTASGDSEGSLGGLVRQGEPGRLEDTILAAIHNAEWCSSDPICIQSLGQGPESCNLAACHNCALLPETCCECGNRLLDRGMIIGTLTDVEIGYFNSLRNRWIFMLIILSQKVDTSSSYADEAFTSYHYPSHYKNQIHEGDTFVYYQGNRFVRDQRYYFGVGTVWKISSPDGENYYATLFDCQKFINKVPIYLPVGKYVLKLGFETVRKSLTPPWQSSARPLSQKTFS